MSVTQKTIFIPFFAPVANVVKKIDQSLDESSIVRVRGFPIRVYCLGDPEHIGQLFAHSPASMTKQPKLLPRVQFVMGDGTFIMRGGDGWRVNRQTVQGAFRRSELAGLMQSLPALIDEMAEDWRRYASSGQTFDSFRPLRLLTSRINIQMFFSRQLEETELRYLEEETHFLEPRFAAMMPLALPLPGNIRFRRFTRRLRSRMQSLIDERRRTAVAHHDVLSHVLTLRDTAGNAASDEEIIDELLSVFFGATAVGISLGWALYLIASHPDVQSRMAHEALEASRESPGGDMVLLSYAQAVIKETLRLYPASWGQPRWTEQRIRFGDTTIPPKSLIIPMVSHVQRDPRYWKNPESFNPDRFLSEESATAHPLAYFPFSAGPRVCVGAGLAPIIMQRVLVGVLSRYKISFVPRFAGDPITDFSFGITPKDEIRIRIELR